MRMKDPVPLEELPPPNRRNPRFEEVYARAAELDGEALPVEFENDMQAQHFQTRFQKCRRGAACGLQARRRGTTVYVWKKGE